MFRITTETNKTISYNLDKLYNEFVQGMSNINYSFARASLLRMEGYVYLSGVGLGQTFEPILGSYDFSDIELINYSLPLRGYYIKFTSSGSRYIIANIKTTGPELMELSSDILTGSFQWYVYVDYIV